MCALTEPERGCAGLADPGLQEEQPRSDWDTFGLELETEVESGFGADWASASAEEAAAPGGALGGISHLSQSSLDLIHEKQRSSGKNLRVLIIGWLEDNFMMETIHEMDHGLVRLLAELFAPITARGGLLSPTAAQ